MIRQFKHWLWVRWMRFRYPKRPIDPRFPAPIWIEREDGLYRLPTHTASPDDESYIEGYPSCMSIGYWSRTKSVNEPPKNI
jgi:hypothetical protein